MLRSLAMLSLLLVATPWVCADDADLQELLEHPILEPNQPLAEVQQYTEARVPPMPMVRSAEEWTRHAEQVRRGVFDKVVFRGEAAAWRDAATRVEWLETIDGGPGYRIKKLRYEALPGLWIPALLYEPASLEGKVPAVLNVNGHDGKGKAAPYKQIRCINQAKRGMLALNVEWFGMGQLAGENFHHGRMNQLDLCGTSGLAPFYLAMTRALDLLIALEHADPDRVAVTGLSGGGWQTITISSLDTRVKLTDPVAGYSSFRTRVRNLSDLGDSEQTPCDLAAVTDYAEMTAMMAPRPTLLTFNAKDDCCFAADHALPPLMNAARPVFELYGKGDNLRSHVNHDPGTHNYEKENREALYRMLGDHFYAGNTGYSAEEIPCADELKSAEELRVALPADNGDFHSLALALGRALPRTAPLPTEARAAAEWQKSRRTELSEVVRAKSYTVTAEDAGSEQKGDVAARFWRLHMGDAWTVPATELTRRDADGSGGCVILVADAGRKSLGDEVRRRVDAGQRIWVVDPFYFGECRVPHRDYLFALLVATVGDRPLGIQASQLAAVARWLETDQKAGPVDVAAFGPRSSLFALVAAALEPRAIGRAELHHSLGSLKEILEGNGSVDKTPELFCFGLLEKFDIVPITALVAPRDVVFREPSDRVGSELAVLKSWYATLGKEFDPLR
jgi:dienelactone hydrolase